MAKKWWRSRGVWLGLCTVSIGVIEVVRQLVESNDFSSLALMTAVVGVLKVVERFSSNGDSVTM